MSQLQPIDANQTIIYPDDEETRPPPRLEVGLLAWLRQNLFGSPADVGVTLVSSLLIVVLVLGFFDWAIRSANWFAVINNQRLFMMESFEPRFEWRLALSVLLAALLTGISLAAWGRRSMRILGTVAVALLLALTILPPLIDASIPQPRSYFAAGNVEIIDRASTLSPQENLAFIAQGDEEVTVRMALEEVADIDTLSELAGFSDRATNALANAARNRIEQQEHTGSVFDQMLSGELTESLEERMRLNVRTFTRTNDMLASTQKVVGAMPAQLADATIADMRHWLERLERAAAALDPQAADIIDAIADIDDGTVNLSMNDGIPSDLQARIAELTEISLASEQLEDLGETLVLQLSEDLIGLPDQPDDDEDLIQPTAPEAAFLRELFVRLLTPQSVLELYQLGQVPMTVAIRDAKSLDILAEATLQSAEQELRFSVPQDGWYILSKSAAAGETGTAIIAATGIRPIVERTLSATESRFVRLTDNELVVTESRPQLEDGRPAPYVVLIDNQFRGLRDLPTYLVHFIPLFFEQLNALLLPFLITVAWGFLVGRGLAHIRGENSIFNSRSNQLAVIAWTSTPLLLLLLYFALLDVGSPLPEWLVIALKALLPFALVALVRRVENWLNRTNRSEGAEGPLDRLLLYGWGAYPFIMYLLASGIGGLSGGALGSFTGGLLWLLLMYFVGLNFRDRIGYALLLLGFFLQIVQAALINLVWEGWQVEPAGTLLLWLLLAALGVAAGLGGAAMKTQLSGDHKRYGYLLSCLVVIFVLFDTSALLPDASAVLDIVPIALWLAWMFFSGSTRWSSNRLLIGILLLSFLWMQSFTSVDRWSIIYFVLWLAAGALVFKRGEEAQGNQRKAESAQAGPLFYRFAKPGLALVALGWLLSLLLLPSIVLALDAQGLLQASPQELLPLSDKRLWGGLMLTMQLTILGVGASFPIGLALALGRRSNLPVVKYACILYIEVVRGVPLITVLFLATLLVPLVDPTLATIENVVRAWVGITLFSAAYLAENVRGGLQSLDRGQTEAAQAVGLSTWQTTIYILLPQALRAVIPALVGQFISLFKDTSLVFIVGLAEITGIAVRVVAQPEFLQRRQETFLYVAIIFFVFSYMMSYISRRIEATGSGAVRSQQI